MHQWINNISRIKVLAHLFNCAEPPTWTHTEESDVVKDCLPEHKELLGGRGRNHVVCVLALRTFSSPSHTVGSQCLAHSGSSASQRTASTSWLAFW